MVKEVSPSFICFTSDVTEHGENMEKTGCPGVSVIMRIEQMNVNEETLLDLKRIQQKAAAEVNALLGW